VNEVEVNKEDVTEPQKATAPKRNYLSEEVLDARVGFNIGWDTYASGMDLLGKRSNYKCIRQGWDAARLQNVKQATEHDRFVHKCLTLRFHAWTRNRHFSDDVTPEFLRYIDVEYCPVTLEKLTHGTMAPTDWSVDRINNNGAYSRSNIAIMSARANTAKWNYSYHKIHGFAHNPDAKIPTELYRDDGTPLTPLTREEWARVSVISSYGPCEQDERGMLSLPKKVTPCVINPPPGLLFSISNFLQMAIANKANVGNLSGGFRNTSTHRMCELSDFVTKGLSTEHKKDFNKLVSRAKKVSYNWDEPLNMWFNKALFLHYLDFYKALSELEHFRMRDMMDRNNILERHTLNRVERLNLNNKGYISQ